MERRSRLGVSRRFDLAEPFVIRHSDFIRDCPCDLPKSVCLLVFPLSAFPLSAFLSVV
jgi:hypothetical protein